MNKILLPRLEDYVFLSDPNSDEIFIIQRTGEIWIQNGTEEWSVPSRSFERSFLNWKNLLEGNCVWKWLHGWLPVLQLENNMGKQISFLVKDNALWVKNANIVTSYPDGLQIPSSRFENEVCRIKKEWEIWFASGWNPPKIHSHIDNAWKASFVQTGMAYSAKHPHYGVAYYGRMEGDGFPPTTLSMVSTLLEYGHIQHAQELFSYFLKRYILPDGNIDYYGVSISELGGILIIGAQMLNYERGDEWIKDHLHYLVTIFTNLVRLHNPVSSRLIQGLIIGSPEADERSDEGAFFHNNAFIWRAFSEWGNTMASLGYHETAIEAKRNAKELKRDIDTAFSVYRNPNGLIPSRIDKKEDFNSFTESRLAAYVNYRYYPELLETGILSRDDAYAIIKTREEKNGEVCGMTYLGYNDKEYSRECHFDNWPLASYARGLLELNDKKRFMKVFIAHALYHQSQDTFTAYEQVTEKGNPRRAYADWCVPCQLVLPKMLAWSFKYRKWDGQIINWEGPSKDDLNQYNAILSG